MDLQRVFISGGAGFIGRRLALSLRAQGHAVLALDNLHPQVHADPEAAVAELAGAGIEFVRGDIRNAALLGEVLGNFRPDTVVHLAAETGTGQSYDMPAHYCDVNVTGTAWLVEAMRSARSQGVPITRAILAGSRAVYGEGACLNPEGRRVTAVPRLTADLANGDFAPKDAAGRSLVPRSSNAATTEPAPASVYASSKLMQEYLLRQGLEQSGIECGILRLQNVYGAGQALHNPYTGVLSIFVQQLLDGGKLDIYEDGEIVRDFVHVDDVVGAFHRMCEIEVVPETIIDIGSGCGTTIREVAETIVKELGLGDGRIAVSGRFRPGDIRHAVADVSTAAHLLGWRPHVRLKDGVASLVQWACESQ